VVGTPGSSKGGPRSGAPQGSSRRGRRGCDLNRDRRGHHGGPRGRPLVRVQDDHGQCDHHSLQSSCAARKLMVARRSSELSSPLLRWPGWLSSWPWSADLLSPRSPWRPGQTKRSRRQQPPLREGPAPPSQSARPSPQAAPCSSDTQRRRGTRTRTRSDSSSTQPSQCWVFPALGSCDSTLVPPRTDPERGDVDLLLVLACLAVLAWLLGPWLVTVVRHDSGTGAAGVVPRTPGPAHRDTTSPSRLAARTGRSCRYLVGTIGRCGLVHVAATTTVPLPSWGGTLGGGVLNLRATATTPGDAYVPGTMVGVCGAL